MTEPADKSAAEVMWQWQGSASPKPPPKSHLTMTLIQTAVAYAIASLLIFYRQHYIAGAIIYTLGTVVLFAGLFIPPLHAAITRFGLWLGRAVGLGMTWLLLVPFFYLFFTTGRLFLLLTGKDPLTRRWNRAAPTYWTDRKPAIDDKHFLRQS
jgi:hypothetical protein